MAASMLEQNQPVCDGECVLGMTVEKRNRFFSKISIMGLCKVLIFMSQFMFWVGRSVYTSIKAVAYERRVRIRE